MSWLACSAPLATVEVEKSGQATIAAGGLLEQIVGDLGFDELQGFDFAASQELRNEGVEPGDIDGVFLTSLTLTAVDGDDLSFLEEVEVFVDAPELDSVLVAAGSGFEGKQSAELETEGVDLTAYAVASSMTVRVEGQGRRPNEDTTVAVAASFDVTVTAQGACAAVR